MSDTEAGVPGRGKEIALDSGAVLSAVRKAKDFIGPCICTTPFGLRIGRSLVSLTVEAHAWGLGVVMGVFVIAVADYITRTGGLFSGGERQAVTWQLSESSCCSEWHGCWDKAFLHSVARCPLPAPFYPRRGPADSTQEPENIMYLFSVWKMRHLLRKEKLFPF